MSWSADKRSISALARGAHVSGRIIAAGVVGSVIEYFDFAVYGYLVTILAVHFFSGDDPISTLLATLATFAVAFVLRPIGGILFGHFGDRYGRKNALAATVILIALASGLIGVLPTYAQIGVWATILLVIARSVQGLAAGGELGGAASFVSEHSPDSKRGFYASTTQTGALAGSLLASLTVTVLNAALGTDAMNSWGWRIPFLIAIPLGLFGLWIRSRLDESESFEKIRSSHTTLSSPFMHLWTSHTREVAQVIGLSVLLFSAYYIAYIYIGIHLQTFLGISRDLAFLSTTITLAIAVVTMPMFGALSDCVGRRAVFIGASVAALVIPVPAFLLLEEGGAVTVTTHVVLGLIDAALMGVAMSTFAELFPSQVRYTGIAFGFSASAALIGGTSPYIATWLVNTTGNLLAPAYFLMATAVVTLLTSFTLRETARMALR